METRFLILFVLVGIISISYAASEQYPRPWENETWVEENPYAYGFFNILFLDTSGSQIADEHKFMESALNQTIPDFQESLEELELERIDGELGEVGATDGNIKEAIIWKEHAGEIRISVEDLIPVKHGWDVWNYPGNWQNCSEHSLLSLESYAKIVNEKRSEFGIWKEKIAYAGVCDDDYIGGSIQYCEMPLEDVNCEYSGIWEDVPRFTWYYGCMHEHWDAIAALEVKVQGIETAYNETVDLCEDSWADAGERKGDAEKKFSEIQKEELDEIYLSSYGKGNSGALGVKGTYEEILDVMKVADESYAEAKNANEGNSKWLKDCILGSGNAIAGYDLILQSVIIEEAGAVVEEYGEEAWENLETSKELETEMGTLGKERLETAGSACKAGDGGGTLGGRFENYGKCIKYANMATEAAKEGEGVIEAYLDAELVWLDGFLKDAETDGIDTHSERAQKELIDSIRPANYVEIIENIEESILEKAEHRYGYLPEKRAMLKSDLSLGGAPFGFLESWFQLEECYSGDSLDYSCALGQLKEMSEAYDEIEGELWGRKILLVESSIIVDEKHSWEIAVLDEPSGVYLYVDVTNPTKFSAEDVVVEVSTDFEFRKIDVVYGTDSVRMVTPTKGKIAIYLMGISAGETVHLEFKKEEVVCRTKDYGEVAFGDSEGGATVTQTLKLNCECAVDGLILGEEFESDKILVNGLRVESAGAGIPMNLAEGAHTIEIETYDYDAYEVERIVSFMSTLGQTTKVELFFNFEPNRDLDYIAYSSIEEGKDLSKLDVFGYTGEKITDKKTMGESTVFFKVHGLVEGKETKVRVTYQISDLDEYMNQQVIYYSGQNLTAEEEAILSEAKNHLLMDEDIGAYQKLEELRSVVENREKTQSKVLEKHEKLKEQIKEKVDALGAATALAHELGLDNLFVREMDSRLEELTVALETGVEPGALIGPLESFDMGWEKRELTKISKELLKLEKEVKESWAETGVGDKDVEMAVEEIEQKNSKFSGSLDFEDAMSAFYAISMAEDALVQLKENAAASDTTNNAILESRLDGAYDLLGTYTREYEEADETHLEGLFPMKPNEVSKLLKEASGSTDPQGAIEDIDVLVDEMEGTIKLLEDEEKRMEENVESLYSEVKDEMEETDAAFVNAAIQNARMYAGKGEYARAINSLEDGIRRLQTFERKQDGLLVLAITGLLVLGIIALYLLRDHIPKDLLPKKPGKEKKYKSLKREI